MVLNTPHGTHDITHMYHDIPHGTQISKDGIPHNTEHPHGTQGNPHGTHHPHGTQDTPTFIMISPTVLNIPPVLKIPPMVLMISPHGTEHSHGTEHPHRYCTHIIQGVYVKTYSTNNFTCFISVNKF